MSLVSQSYWLHASSVLSSSSVGVTNPVIDATGEKIAMLGSVRTPDGASRSIRTLGFRFGSVTKAGGSGLTVSLQNVDTANGPVHRPDGTQDQTVAIANGNASFASNTWINTGNLSADRSVNHGDLLAVVVEYDGSGRLGADSVQVTGFPFAITALTHHNLNYALFTTSWATQALLPNVLLGFSDCSFGTFLGVDMLASAVSSLGLTFGNGDTPDEYATKYTFPNDCKVDAIRFPIFVPTGADFDVVIEGGVGGTVTVAVDANTIVAASSSRLITVAFPPIEFGAGDIGYFTIRPSTATQVSTHFFDVNAAGHLGALAGGTAMHIASRTNGGAWSPTTTRRLLMDLHIAAVDDGGGGNAKASGNMMGGLQ